MRNDVFLRFTLIDCRRTCNRFLTARRFLTAQLFNYQRTYGKVTVQKSKKKNEKKNEKKTRNEKKEKKTVPSGFYDLILDVLFATNLPSLLLSASSHWLPFAFPLLLLFASVDPFRRSLRCVCVSSNWCCNSKR